MPTISDYLQRPSGGNVTVVVGTWVQLTNNVTSTAYVATAATDANGKFTVNNVPAGTYTVATGPASIGPFTGTGDTNYVVSDQTLQFNVKDFGAKGDGVTNDTTSINAAETAAAVSGGTVYFPFGTYIAQGIVKLTGADWVGAGIGATILKLPNSAATGTPLVIGQNFATLTGTNSTAGINSFTIRGITFDGNQVNNATYAVPLIQWYAYGYRMLNFVVQNAGNVGMYSEWANDGTGPVINPGFEAHLIDFAFINNFSTGLQWNGPHDSVIGDGQVENSRLHGIHLQSKGGAATQFRNVHCWGGTSDWSWYLEDSCYLFQCEGEDGTAGAVWIRTTGGVQIMGGSFFLTPIGIRLGVTAGAAATKCSVLGAQISGCSSSAFDFQNDGGGNSLDFYTSGSANTAISTGTQTATTVISRVNGNGLREWITQGATHSLLLNDNSANGPTLALRGSGGTNQKTIRVNNGNDFQILNAAESAIAWQFDDFGSVYQSGAHYRKAQQPAFNATPAVNLNNGDFFAMAALTGNVTAVGAPTANALVAGARLTFVWLQDGTGTRTVTYNAIYHTSTFAAMVTTANTVTIDEFVYDGTAWRGVSRQTGQT